MIQKNKQKEAVKILKGQSFAVFSRYEKKPKEVVFFIGKDVEILLYGPKIKDKILMDFGPKDVN